MTARQPAPLALKFVLLTLCLLGLFAIFVQDYSGFIPSCVFNRGHALYYACSGICVALLVIMAGIIAFARQLRVLFAAVTFLLVCMASECIIRIVDTLLVDRPVGLIGHYYNREGSVLMRPTRDNQLGFNEGHDYTTQVPDNTTRLLFLGDSYTFGSASTREASYCKVVESYLNRHSTQRFEILNAGVPGYSPHDSSKLLKLLRANGYKYRAVVFSLYLQNDFTDEVANTYRKAVGGTIQRFPDNVLLSYCHPLNSYCFRYATVMKTMLSEKLIASRDVPPAPVAQASSEEASDYKVSPLLFERLDTNYARSAKPAYEDVYLALMQMAEEAKTPFYIVVFPDQCVSDAATREYLLRYIDRTKYDFDAYSTWVSEKLSGFSRIDLTPILSQSDNIYISGDTHLNDKGNRIAGEAVGEYLLGQLADSSAGVAGPLP